MVGRAGIAQIDRNKDQVSQISFIAGNTPQTIKEIRLNFWCEISTIQIYE